MRNYKARPPRIRIGKSVPVGDSHPGIYRVFDPNGVLLYFDVYAKVGGRRYRKEKPYFPPDTRWSVMEEWQASTRRETEDELLSKLTRPGSLAAAVEAYLTDTVFNVISHANRTQRRAQFRWWCAQPAARGAKVISRKQVAADVKKAGLEENTFPPERLTLGIVQLEQLDEDRIIEICAQEFAATVDNPTKNASTQIKYQDSLRHLLAHAFRKSTNPPELLKNLHERTQPPPKDIYLDPRVIQMVFPLMKRNPETADTPIEIIVKVLASVPITPRQLWRLNPDDFNDLPGAEWEDYEAGRVTLRMRARDKGANAHAGGYAKPDEIKPLTPWGADAMRAFRDANLWGRDDHRDADGERIPAVDKTAVRRRFRRACLRLHAQLSTPEWQTSLRKRDIVVADLLRMTTYNLKHCLAAIFEHASLGRISKNFKVRPSKGTVTQLGHASEEMTTRYTHAANFAILRESNRMLMHLLHSLFDDPLKPEPKLKIVGGDE